LLRFLWNFVPNNILNRRFFESEVQISKFTTVKYNGSKSEKFLFCVKYTVVKNFIYTLKHDIQSL